MDNILFQRKEMPTLLMTLKFPYRSWTSSLNVILTKTVYKPGGGGVLLQSQHSESRGWQTL